MNFNVEANRPDFSLANRIRIIFDQDPQVSADFVNATNDSPAKIILSVSNSNKAAAIRKMLPEKYNISLPLLVEVKDTSEINGNTVKNAFNGNPHFKDFIEILDPLTGTSYPVCIFKEEVIKFKNDNGGSLHGFEFRLMEDLCKEVFEVPKLIFTTDDGLPYEINTEEVSNSESNK